MKLKVRKFFGIAFIALIVICMFVFACLSVFMTQRTQESITNISKIYMDEISMQLQQKFSTIIELRLYQVGVITQEVLPDSVSGDAMYNELIKSAKARNFSYLGFYMPDGGYIPIYGENADMVVNAEKFTKSLDERGYFISEGVNESGEKLVFLGKAANYQMEDGTKSVALVAGISVDYISSSMYLYEEESIVYSFIIRKDGDFIVKSPDVEKDNYFERVKYKYYNNNEQETEKYIDGLKSAMNEKKYFANLVMLDGKEKYIYCSPISENLDWYLVSVMSNDALADEINELGKIYALIIFGAAFVILLAMSIACIVYYRVLCNQLKELNKSKQEADKANKAKSDFLSSMSHDIRTPMNAIIGMTEIAFKHSDDKSRVLYCLDKIKLSSKHLLGLINDVLDMSKIESGKITLNISPLSLRETMEDIVNIMQSQIKEKNLHFDIFIEKIETENIQCDSVRLNQVLLNVLSNAVKFTPENGRIDIYLYQEPSALGEEYIRTHFRIKDTGIGMSEDFKKKIFESFERENTEQVQKILGTGLGMAITKCIVDLMGGTIEVESELGKGSEFHIVLDLKKSNTEEEDFKLPPWNILVVDDNKQLCESAVSNLTELGANAEWTLDGLEAIEMIKKRNKEHNDYKFVLIDWKMPNMDGVQTIQKIRETLEKKVPVFLISAYDWSEIKDRASLEDIEGFIQKPLFKSTLFSYLKQYTEANNEQKKKESSQMDFTDKKILLAEDIDINFEVANEILTSVGFEIERAVDGKDCLEKFEGSDIGFYDLILMDIRMPVMNGFDSTKAIRSLDREDNDIPIIAMTADAFSDDVKYCIENGMNAHIAKPIDFKELMRVLQKFLQ